MNNCHWAKCYWCIQPGIKLTRQKYNG